MRITLLSIVVVLFCGGASIAQTQMIAHWPLDGNTQEVVNGLHGVPSTSGVSWVSDDPQRGQVMQLDGVSGYVTLPSEIWTNPEDTTTTVTCWYNFGGGVNWQRVFSFGRADVSWAPWGTFNYGPRDGDGHLRITFLGKTTPWLEYPIQYCADNAIVLDTAKWYFTAVVFYGDSVKMWLNDQVICYDSIYVKPQGFQWADSSENFLGKSHWKADATFNGMIDDFRIYDGALSDAEVMALFDEGNVGTGDLKKELPIKLYAQLDKIMYSNVDESSVNEVSVYSITGSLLFRTNKISELPSRSFNSGIYLVTVKTGQGLISRKVAVLQ